MPRRKIRRLRNSVDIEWRVEPSPSTRNLPKLISELEDRLSSLMDEARSIHSDLEIVMEKFGRAVALSEMTRDSEYEVNDIFDYIDERLSSLLYQD